MGVGGRDKVFMSLDHGDRRSDGSQNLGLNLGFVFYLPCELRESPNLCPYFTVQFSHSVVSNSLWPMDGSMPGFPVHHQLPELVQTCVHQVGDAIQPSHPLSSPSSPTFNLSQHQGLFQWVSSSHQMAKVLEFSFSISPSNEYSGLISFRIDWLDLLAVQGTLKSLLQHHSSKASILQRPASLFNFTVTWVLLFGILIMYFMIHQDLNGLTHLKFSYIQFFELKVFWF